MSQIASGTVIYLRISQAEVVVAADSKRTFVKANGITESASVCKILQAEDVFFASAGVGGGAVTGFDVGQVARQAIKGGGTLAEMVRSFQLLLAPPLVRTLEIIRDSSPMRYKGFLQGAAAQTVFVRIENGSPLVLVSSNTPVEDSDGRIKLQASFFSCPGTCKLPGTFSIGSSLRADQIEGKTKNFWDRGSIAGVLELMNVSIEDNLRNDGKPIDILRISKDGAEWVEVKKECNVDEGFSKD
ncbi:MAG: hypothetical protein ABL960_00055 [Nitrospira sp.]